MEFFEVNKIKEKSVIIDEENGHELICLETEFIENKRFFVFLRMDNNIPIDLECYTRLELLDLNYYIKKPVNE